MDTARLKILGAEDSISQRVALQAFIEAQGYQFIPACDGQQAVAAFIEEQPDLVILDIEMPVMDGIEAAKKIKALAGDHYVPVIFLTQLDPENLLQQCVLAGGDDFIPKPIKATLLYAKISALLRVQQLYEALTEQNKQLRKYQLHQEQEHYNAAQFQKSVIRSRFHDSPCLRYSVSAMAMFSGDFILSTISYEGNLYTLIGDFTGHGLSASLGTTFTSEIFYTMSEKDCDPIKIIEEINNKLSRVLPKHIFLAATLLVYNPRSLTVELINCGLPGHLWVRQIQQQVGWLESVNIPLGIDQNLQFNKQTIQTEPDDVILLFTDGLTEARDIEGNMFGMETLQLLVRQGVNKSEQNYFDTIHKVFNWHVRGAEQQDDMTLLELSIGKAVSEHPDHLPVAKPWDEAIALPWSFQFDCTADMCKPFHPVRQITDFIVSIQNLAAFKQDIHLIISELFNNALEHGLLQLDSALKSSPESFQDYYNLRQQRLAELKDGMITLKFKHDVEPNGGTLRIMVEDSGPGFSKVHDVPVLANNEQLFGRGLALVKSLAQRLVIHGNRVQVVYRWYQP
ncbi:MAG: fused response regulator/phosphatase [Methylococcales bacterium]|nr:fused response regulator/phosphatase [Methylococcales bacterium]